MTTPRHGADTVRQVPGAGQQPPPPGGVRVLARRYHLIAPLGRGTMGVVWEAYDLAVHRKVAVKEVLLPADMSDHDRAVSRERAQREARAISQLAHPNVIAFYDLVEEAGHPWVVMELVNSRSLADVIRAEGALPLQRIATLSLAILGALEAAHRAGITHRDVKPSNILLTDDGRVKLTDFGIARTAGDSPITGAGMLVGSPSYIPPEVIQGAAAGPPADMWGLGATLYAAVEARAPFDAGDPMATLHAVVSDPTPSTHRAGPLAEVIDGLLRKDPRRRLDTVKARRHLLDALRAFDRERAGSGGAPSQGSVPASAELPLDNGGSGAPSNGTAALNGNGLRPVNGTLNGTAAGRHDADPLPTPDPALNDAEPLAAPDDTGATEYDPLDFDPANFDPAKLEKYTPAEWAPEFGAVSEEEPPSYVQGTGSYESLDVVPTAYQPPDQPATQPAPRPYPSPYPTPDNAAPADAEQADAAPTYAAQADAAPTYAAPADAEPDAWQEPSPAPYQPPAEIPTYEPPAVDFDAPPYRPSRAAVIPTPQQPLADRLPTTLDQPAEDDTAVIPKLPSADPNPGGSEAMHPLAHLGETFDPDEIEDNFGNEPWRTPRPAAIITPPGYRPATLDPGTGETTSIPALFDRPPPADPRLPTTTRRKRTGRTAGVLVAVAVLCIAGYGGYWLTQHFAGQPGHPAAAAPTTPAGNSTGSQPTKGSSKTKPSNAPVEHNSAFTTYQSPAGYTVAVPNGWKSDPQGTGVIDFNDPHNDRFIRFVSGVESPDDLVAGFEAAEKTFKADHQNYKRIVIKPVKYHGNPAADWEFSYTRGTDTRKVLYRSFTVNSKTYGIYISAPDGLFNRTVPAFNKAARSFAVQ